MSKESTAPQVGDTVDLEIERLSFGGGRGVGRHNNFVVFVPFTIPQEKIKAKIIAVHKTFAEAELLEVLQASEHRRPAPCPYFMACGGCDWQHISYEHQVETKLALLKTMFTRSRITSKPEVKIVVPAEKNFNYRNRIQLHRRKNQIGYFKRNSGDLVEIDSCMLAEEPLNNFLKHHRKELQSDRFELRLNSNDDVEVRTGKDSQEAADFSQVNRWQNESLKALVLNLLQEIKPTHAYDLYCGKGNFFDLFLQLENFEKLRGVELSKTSVRAARESFSSAIEEERLDVQAMDVEKFLQREKVLKNSLILVDPPRTGLNRKICDLLSKSPAKYILYVSCNPTTLVRDLEWMTSTNLWSATKMWGVDMFPQTEHLETLTLVQRP